MDNTPYLLTIPEAARVAGVSTYRIRAAISSGELLALDIATGSERAHWRIHPNDLSGWQAQLRGARRD